MSTPDSPEIVGDPDWASLDFAAIQERLERQRSRVGRIRVPSWEEVVRVWPTGSRVPEQPIPTLWRRICVGYQPALSDVWTRCNQKFHEETPLDAVQQQSLFWVVTRSLNCFYCMGHTEMSLEVAGLDRNAIAERTRRLGSGDWSAFPAAERTAFAFARKVTKTPWMITADDVRVLTDHFGDKRLSTSSGGRVAGTI